MKSYTAAEAAQKLGVSVRRVRQYCEEGRIGSRFGAAWMITDTELKRFAKRPRPSGRPIAPPKRKKNER